MRYLPPMGRWCGVGFGFAALAVWMEACAGASSTAEVAEAAPAAPATGRVRNAPASASGALPTPTAQPIPRAAQPISPAASASAAPSPAAAPGAPILAICLAKCDKLLGKCGAPSVESCRLNCTKYDPPPPGCGDQVRAGLECARDARDLTCANVAPESCARKFREIAACAAGEPAQPAEKAAPGLPEGWEQLTDSANGFSAAMPLGSVVKAGPEGPVRSVMAADATIYTVSVLPPLNDQPSEKTILHFLMKGMGRCSDKVKLDGFVEKGARSSIHYQAHCPDKSDWSGMVYTSHQRLFLLSAQAASGKMGLTEPFFYQFTVL